MAPRLHHAIRATAVAAAAIALLASPVAADTLAPPERDPVITSMLGKISATDLRAIDERLVGFGTRNLFSERSTDRKRGVFRARDWLVGAFRAIAEHSGGRMSVALDTFEQPKTARTPRDVTVSSVIATLRGDDPGRGVFVLSSHYDSRNSDGNDATRDAPGADDNGSGTSLVVEAARVMAATHYRATIVFACFDGEEQGLFGSSHFAKRLAAANVRVEGNLNDDIVGASLGHDGERASNEVRLFSEALPADAQLDAVNAAGTENDSLARELARTAKEVGEAYVTGMDVRMVFRADRFLRGGDQESFTASHFPAIRYVEAHENFDHQHQNVRVENGVRYGDLIDFVDFDYLARVTALNVATLADLAMAPSAPTPVLDARSLSYDAALSWSAVPSAASYQILWRRTDEMTWTHSRDLGAITTATLPLSKDDWLFGVRAVDSSGHVSVTAFPSPRTR